MSNLSGQVPIAGAGEAICIGVDLAWGHRQRTGLALMRLNPKTRRVVLSEASYAQDDDEIIAWIEQRRGPTTVVGIDAPIIAPNAPGTHRPCDRELQRFFGRYHAGPFPANREKCKRPIDLRENLERLGYDADPENAPRHRGHWLIEVFPHPAQVVLFNLAQILKYKKGPRDKRRAGLRQLAVHIQDDLSGLVPRLARSSSLRRLCQFDHPLSGRALKQREDQLDAVVCAYVAAYYWFWGAERCKVWGDVESGYIVCPRHPAHTEPC